jgi:hypothetical protein
VTPLDRMLWARDVEVYGAAKAVLWALVARVGAELTCQCSRRELAHYAGLKSTKGVTKAITELESVGVVAIEGDRSDGNWNRYRLVPNRQWVTHRPDLAGNVIPSPGNTVPAPGNVIPQGGEPGTTLIRAGGRAGERAGEGDPSTGAPADTLPLVVKQPDKPPEPPVPKPEPRRRTKAQVDAEAVWAVYREERARWKPSTRPPARWRSAIKVVAAVKDVGRQGMIDLIRWAHRSPDSNARYLRGENPDGKEYMEETLFRADKRKGYATAAARWKRNGSVEVVTVTDTTTGRQTTPEAAASAAWDALMALPGFARANRANPPVKAGQVVWGLAETREEHDRRFAALQSAGGYHGYCLADDYTRPKLKAAFIKAYAEGAQ